MNSTTEKNKAIVARFNKEVIEEGNMESFNQLVIRICANRMHQGNCKQRRAIYARDYEPR